MNPKLEGWCEKVEAVKKSAKEKNQQKGSGRGKEGKVIGGKEQKKTVCKNIKKKLQPKQQ
jgi:hypothetical protein